MPLVNSKEILQEARRKGYGIPGLLGGNLEMVIGMVKAAEDAGAPLILVYNQEVNPKVPLALGMSLIVSAARAARVPVATILDHGHNLDMVVEAIKYGATSVMFDGSNLPYAENIRQTREVTEYAHAAGVCVEAELGCIGGSAVDPDDLGPQSAFTNPQVASDFVHQTGVDALAISFGNVHGVYRGEPRLDLQRVMAIHAAVDIPLVMHGGSGLDEHIYPKIVASGISKVCYYTSMARRAFREIKTCMENAGSHAAYHDLTSWSIDFFYKDTKRLLEVLGCAGAVKNGTL